MWADLARAVSDGTKEKGDADLTGKAQDGHGAFINHRALRLRNAAPTTNTHIHKYTQIHTHIQTRIYMYLCVGLYNWTADMHLHVQTRVHNAYLYIYGRELLPQHLDLGHDTFHERLTAESRHHRHHQKQINL